MLLVLSYFAICAGCVPIGEFSVQQIQKPGAAFTKLDHFDGLESELIDAANNNGTLRLLVVQGMGLHDPGFSTNLIDRVAANLNLRFVGGTNIIIPERPYYSTLDIRNFANGSNRMCVYELTWSPLTAIIKTNAFALDMAPQQISTRLVVNNSLKVQLMDESLSDVVLYVGKFRPYIQLPVTNAIYQMVADSSPNDPISIITHSLAGYIVVDTLSSMYDSDASKSVAHNYASHVRQLFMMANQLPILNLSDLTDINSNPSSLEDKLNQVVHPGTMLQSAKNPIQIVAFSDPNDLLSYKLRPSDIQEQTTQVIKEASRENAQLIFPSSVHVNAFNVTYTVNPWSILGIVSNPTWAHNDWWTDPGVPRFLAFGCETNNQ